MKKLLALLIAAVAAACLGLSACNFNVYLTDADFAMEGKATVVVAAAETVEYEIDLKEIKKGESAYSLLTYLVENKNLSMNCSFSAYGAYINSFGDPLDENKNLNPDAMNREYICVYTNVEKDFDVSAYKTTVEYNGTTLTSSGVGVSSMSVVDGAVIYLTIASY